MIYAGVGQHIMLAGPLHGSLVQHFNTAGRFQWVTVNLMPYKGQRVHLEFTPAPNSDFALQCVVESPQAPAMVDRDAGVRLSYFDRVETLADAAKQTGVMLRTALENLEIGRRGEKAALSKPGRRQLGRAE